MTKTVEIDDNLYMFLYVMAEGQHTSVDKLLNDLLVETFQKSISEALRKRI